MPRNDFIGHDEKTDGNYFNFDINQLDINKDLNCKKKNKKHRKHKKSQSNQILTISDCLSEKKHVSFGFIKERCYSRLLGGSCSVPIDGSWPLGLSWEYEDNPEISIDEFERIKQEDLEKRIASLSDSKKKLCTGETRSLCHRKDPNPLFTFLREKERKAVLIKCCASTSEDIISLESENSHECLELQKIRFDRANVGCNCKDIGGKMSRKKKIEFIKSWGIEISKGDDIDKIYSENLSKNNKACSHSCGCEREGIQCHYRVCNCCSKKQHCNNKYGCYNYNENSIRQCRYRVLNMKGKVT